jgi:hypothetical protein
MQDVAAHGTAWHDLPSRDMTPDRMASHGTIPERKS